MGRGNGISENDQWEKSHSVKIVLPKNVNNNNKNYKKCVKEYSHSNQDLEQGKIEVNLSSKSTNLDFQNGNVVELHNSKHGELYSSGRASLVFEQNARALKVIRYGDNGDGHTEKRKEVFKFWSSKDNSESSDVNTFLAKSKPSEDQPRNLAGSKPMDYDRGSDFSKNVFVKKSTTRQRAQEIFPASGFAHIDEHVLSLSNQIQSQNISIKDIVQKITENSSNEVEKLRAIWIWLCHNISYDVQGFLGRSPKIYRAEDVLETRQAVCAGYAGLCKEMCREVGIQCREVSGFSRGAECSGSERFHRTKSNHMWNAVELGGDWHLLDACWGAGTVDFQKEIFIPSYDDFFFLTAPEDFIETHWPDESSWQLLELIVPFQDFEQTIFKTSEFFRLKLSIVSPNVFYLTTEDGEVKVSLRCLNPMEFSYKIYKLHNNSRSLVMKTFGILTNHKFSMTLRVFPPTHGQYELMIFARPTDTTDAYKWVCSYHVDCPQPKSSLGLPENPFHFWGLQQKANEIGVIGYNSGEDLIVSETGSLNLVFRTSRPLVATFQLSHPEMSEALTRKCLVSQIEDTQLRCKLLLPLRGYYRLSLFVKELDRESFQNAANVLIQCKNPVNHNELFPSNLSNHCGPGTNSRRNGLSNPSRTSPVIRTTTGICNFTFHALWNLEVIPILDNGKENHNVTSLDRYCLLTYLEHEICLTVHLPDSGHYKLSIFTKSHKDAEFSHACDYIIRCFSNKRLLPFPKLYSAWKPGFRLLHPLGGLLPSESWEDFRVKIPGAYKVLVIGPIKTELQLKGDKTWEGKVFTGTAGSLIKIAVKFTPTSTDMEIVMSFTTQQTGIDNCSG